MRRILQRFSWEGYAATAVALALVWWSISAGQVAIRKASDYGRQAGQRDHRALAEAVVELLDARIGALGATVQQSAETPSLGAAVAGKDPAPARWYLETLVNGQPYSSGFALYGMTGTRLAATSADAPRQVRTAAWFDPLTRGRATRAVSILSRAGGDMDLAVAVPVRTGTRGSGVLLGWQSLASISARLQPALVEAGLCVQVLDSAGQGVAAWGAEDKASNPAEKQQRSARVGLAEGRGGTQEPGWGVMAVDEAQHGQVPIRVLVVRMESLALPAVVLLVLATWVLFSFYYRQWQLAHRLREHNRRLQETADAKSDFLANVSHDLRTPLAGLRVSISGLLDPDLPWNEELVRTSLETASDQVEQMASRVGNLLQMAHLESGSPASRMETCDLTDIVGAAIERMGPLLPGRKLNTDFHSEPLFVECDPAQIETVVVNLIENALKYSPAGSALHLTGVRCEPDAVVTVRDEGPGVRPGDEERVFEKFYRASTVGPVGGTGLGLAICRTIVLQHGGAIGVRNGTKAGAEFWFSLPLAVAAPADDDGVPT